MIRRAETEKEKRTKSRNVFYFWRNLYTNQEGGVGTGKTAFKRANDWNDLASGHLATTNKTGHDLYPMETGGEGFGFYLVFLSNVLTSGAGNRRGYVLFVYNLMRCVWKRTFSLNVSTSLP